MVVQDLCVPNAFLAGGQVRPGGPVWHDEHKTTDGSGTKLKVLVVDDEPIIADTIREILNRNGFIAQSAYGGDEALQAAEQFSPDILLTDVLMPKINGVDLAIMLSKFHPGTRVLLFSGQATTGGVLDEARARGFEFEVLAKPIPPDQLILKLRRA